MMDTLRKNILANSSSRCVARTLDWTLPPSWFFEKKSEESSSAAHNVILSCDCVFGNTKGWNGLIDNILVPYMRDVDRNAIVLLAYEERDDYFPSVGFFPRLNEVFHVRVIKNISDRRFSLGTFGAGGGTSPSSSSGSKVSIFRLYLRD